MRRSGQRTGVWHVGEGLERAACRPRRIGVAKGAKSLGLAAEETARGELEAEGGGGGIVALLCLGEHEEDHNHLPTLPVPWRVHGRVPGTSVLRTVYRVI